MANSDGVLLANNIWPESYCVTYDVRRTSKVIGCVHSCNIRTCSFQPLKSPIPDSTVRVHTSRRRHPFLSFFRFHSDSWLFLLFLFSRPRAKTGSSAPQTVPMPPLRPPQTPSKRKRRGRRHQQGHKRRQVGMEGTKVGPAVNTF